MGAINLAIATCGLNAANRGVANVYGVVALRAPRLAPTHLDAKSPETAPDQEPTPREAFEFDGGMACSQAAMRLSNGSSSKRRSWRLRSRQGRITALSASLA